MSNLKPRGQWSLVQGLRPVVSFHGTQPLFIWLKVGWRDIAQLRGLGAHALRPCMWVIQRAASRLVTLGPSPCSEPWFRPGAVDQSFGAAGMCSLPALSFPSAARCTFQTRLSRAAHLRKNDRPKEKGKGAHGRREEQMIAHSDVNEPHQC